MATPVRQILSARKAPRSANPENPPARAPTPAPSIDYKTLAITTAVSVTIGAIVGAIVQTIWAKAAKKLEQPKQDTPSPQINPGPAMPPELRPAGDWIRRSEIPVSSAIPQTQLYAQWPLPPSPAIPTIAEPPQWFTLHMQEIERRLLEVEGKRR